MTAGQTSVLGLVLLIFSIPLLVHGLTHPALLRRRARIGPIAEREPKQRVIVALLMPCIAAMWLVSALDHAHGWSKVPVPLVVMGDLLVAVGLLLIWLVFRANDFAAATVQVEPGQSVVRTGPYALVRHPMYLGGLLLFLGIPMGIGSWWGLTLFLALSALIIWRLLEEETFLLAHLPGYQEYCAEVRYRLIPFVW